MLVIVIVNGQTKSTTTLSQFTSFATPHQKFINLVNKADRYGASTTIPITQKNRIAGNGVTYYINKGTGPALPSATNGTTQISSVQNDLVVCKVTPRRIIKQLAGPLFIGTSVNPSLSVIYPGALFKDDDVIVGNFTPLSLPRTPGSILIDVQNNTGNISRPVQNFNNRTEVMSQINTLRTDVQNSYANAYLDKFETSFQSTAQVNIGLEANMDLNLAPIIEIPVQVAANNSASFSFENSLNLATAAIFQVYYTISVGGEGPKSTIQGSVPSNALCVTDVQYGRIAFITVGSFTSRNEADLTMGQLLSVGLDKNTTIAEAERQLSASAKFALQAGFVKIKITGGSVSSAVAVNSLQTFRDYIEQINPTVSGSQAVPIFYSLRYAADNAPARIGAIADINDEECFRADQLKITLNSIKATQVVDFGDEELYGTVSVGTIGKIYSGNATLWSASSSSPKQAATNTNIVTNSPTVTFNVNGAATSASSVTFTINIKDKIMGDPEFVGASQTAKDNGFVQYTPSSFTVPLADIKNATNGILIKTFNIEEGTAKVAVAIKLQLINSTAVTQ